MSFSPDPLVLMQKMLNKVNLGHAARTVCYSPERGHGGHWDGRKIYHFTCELPEDMGKEERQTVCNHDIRSVNWRADT